MNILRHELKQNLKTTAIWTVAILAVVGLYISIYPSLVGVVDFTSVLSNFPEAFKKSFGITDYTFSVFSGLYAMILNLVLLTGAIQAMNLGTSLNSKEISNQTADFLLSKPVSRRAILNQKLLAGLALLIATNIVILSCTWLIIQAVINEPFGFKVFIFSSLSLLLIQLFFLGLGFLIGAARTKIKSVIAISLPVVFGFYIFGLLDTIIGENKIKYLTPFKFFDLAKLTSGESYPLGMLVYLALLVALFVGLSYFIYQKKDIDSV